MPEQGEGGASALPLCLSRPRGIVLLPLAWPIGSIYWQAGAQMKGWQGQGPSLRRPHRHHEPPAGLGQQQDGWGLTKAATSDPSSARYLRRSPWPDSLTFCVFPAHTPATPSTSILLGDLSKRMLQPKDARQDRLIANREGLSEGSPGKTPRALPVLCRLRPPRYSPSPHNSWDNWR